MSRIIEVEKKMMAGYPRTKGEKEQKSETKYLKPMLKCSINKCQVSLCGLSSRESLSEVTAADNSGLVCLCPHTKATVFFFFFLFKKRLAPRTEATGEGENLASTQLSGE